jgi:hypothetical protein|tara:strand:- start:703 stop:921 length:219 start_codon:yes stop_codon:yes gene_type:complete
MKKLDLHGLSHNEAVSISENWILVQSQEPLFECKIIVGNSSTMTKRITDVLDTYGFKYYIPSWNVGEIIVSN